MRRIIVSGAIALATLGLGTAAIAADEPELKEQHWHFTGPFGTYDRAGGEGCERDGARDEELAHGAHATFFLSTASAMLGGKGNGRSILPRIGSSTMKWKK